MNMCNLLRQSIFFHSAQHGNSGQPILIKVKVKSGIAVHGTPSHSYGVSLAIPKPKQMCRILY